MLFKVAYTHVISASSKPALRSFLKNISSFSQSSNKSLLLSDAKAVVTSTKMIPIDIRSSFAA